MLLLFNFLDLLRTKSKLGLHKTVHKNKNFCGILMSSDATKSLTKTENLKRHILKSLKLTDLNIILKIHLAQSTGEYIPSGVSISTISLFKDIKYIA